MKGAEDVLPAERLMSFVAKKQVPNFLLHGNAGCGKSEALRSFLRQVYKGKETSPELVLSLDCARNRGTSFVREDLKHFARSQLACGGSSPPFRSVIVRNADLLTHDAQSALRRCIEVYSHTTRFFLLAQDTSRLLRPVLSRFCAIYFPGGTPVKNDVHEVESRMPHLVRLVNNAVSSGSCILKHAQSIYEKGYSGPDLLSAQIVKGLDTVSRLRIEKAALVLSDDRLLIAYVLNRLRSNVR